MDENFAIDLDFNKTIKALSLIQKSQLPFASAKSLTYLAGGAQRANKSNLSKKFKVRNKKRLESGIRITPASKKDFIKGTQSSSVKELDEHMGRQEFGGTKKAKQGDLAIPGSGFNENDRTSKGSIKKSKKPRALINKMTTKGRPRKRGKHRKPKPFVMKKNGKPIAIAIRTGNTKKPLKYIYNFTDKSKVLPRFQFVKTVQKYVIANYGKTFAKEIENSLK